MSVLAALARELAGGLDYAVPDQDLSVDLARIPAAPASGLVLDDVRIRE